MARFQGGRTHIYGSLQLAGLAGSISCARALDILGPDQAQRRSLAIHVRYFQGRGWKLD